MILRLTRIRPRSGWPLRLVAGLALCASSWYGTHSAEPPGEPAPPPQNEALDAAEKPPAKAPEPAADERPGKENNAKENNVKEINPKEKRPAGRLIRVPLPITGSVDSQVKRAAERALAELPKDNGRPILVFEFYPTHNKFGEGSDFGRALNLANFLSSRELSAAKTVAFIPKTIKGHGVLVAMACEEIVMAPDAEIGDAGIDLRQEDGIDPTIRSGYYQIAQRRKTIPAQVALGMLDREIEVLQVETDLSSEFVLRSELEDLKRQRTVQSEKVIIPAGQLGLFTGRTARELGFVKYLAADRTALAKALGLPATALEDDPTLGGKWRAVRIMVKGAMNPNTAQRVQKMIQTRVEEGDANFVCLWIDSPGGSLVDSLSVASYLAGLDPAQVRTVAYIPNEAYGDAALIALACDQVVMQRDATLGGSGAEAFSPEELADVRKTVRDSLAPKKSRTWSLIVALLDPDLAVYKYTHRTTGLVEYFSEEEAKSQADPDAWVQGPEVRVLREPLKVHGPQAEELGLARHSVGDFGEFRQLYNIEDDVSFAELGWADALIDALATPGVAWLLLFVGVAALYAELHSPGIGIGAFVAGISFLLFFWSKYLEGTAGWLEVLLFMAGLICILLEIFVLPGTAIFGLGGGLLVIVSLVLASQTFVLPHNDYQFQQLRDTLLGLSAVTFGVVLAAVAMRRFFPNALLFNHMVLKPPSSAEMEHLAQREALVDFDYLLGRTGVTTTQLVPAGKARFDGQFVDVSSTGDFIDRGTAVTVVEVHGNRVVVRPIA